MICTIVHIVNGEQDRYHRNGECLFRMLEEKVVAKFTFGL